MGGNELYDLVAFLKLKNSKTLVSCCKDRWMQKTFQLPKLKKTAQKTFIKKFS
jgi:hypothetical protein